MIAWVRRYWPLLLLVALQGLFLTWPYVDLRVSAAFYSAAGGFDLADDPVAAWLIGLFGHLHLLLLLLLPWLMLASLHWVGDAERRLRRKLYFVFLVVAVAPGIAVAVLNAQSGRAHPVDVEVFGGTQPMTAAFQPADACADDCSFVSQSAAGGFVLIVFAWVLGDRRWLWLGLLAGAGVGLLAIASGRHFLSDVVFAYWIVYAACLAGSWLLFRRTRIVGGRNR